MTTTSRKQDVAALEAVPGEHVEQTTIRKPREHKAERDHRLRELAAESRHRRLRELLILIAVLAVTGVVAVLSVGIVVTGESSSDRAKWAMGVLTTLVSGGIGYMLGRGKSGE